MTFPVEQKLPGEPISRQQFVAEWEDLHRRNLMKGPVASFSFDVHYWHADRPVRSQSAGEFLTSSGAQHIQRPGLQFPLVANAA